MIRLLYTGTKEIDFNLTENPITFPQQSPAPTGEFLEELDEHAPDYEAKKHSILKHPNYSESVRVTLKKGVNEFTNEEHAEYIYKILGNPEDGGVQHRSNNFSRPIKNKNVVVEVDKEGKEIKTNLYQKYRIPSLGLSVPDVE